MRWIVFLAALLAVASCEENPSAAPDPVPSTPDSAQASSPADVFVSDMLPEAIRRGAWLVSGQEALTDLWEESAPGAEPPLLKDPDARAAVTHFGGISPCATVEALNIRTSEARVVIDTRVDESTETCIASEAFWTIVAEIAQDHSLPADAIVVVTERGTEFCSSDDPSRCEVPARR